MTWKRFCDACRSLKVPLSVSPRRLQLGRPPGRHRHRRVPGQDWLRRVGGVGGLVLGPDPRHGPRPVDAADREDLGVHGLPHPPRPLRPDQEAHPHSGEGRAPRVRRPFLAPPRSQRLLDPFYRFVLTLLRSLRRVFAPQHAALSEYRPILANRTQSSFFSTADMKLTLIPVIFIVLRVWSTVRFVLLLADSPARQNPVLVTLHVSVRPPHPPPLQSSASAGIRITITSGFC